MGRGAEALSLLSVKPSPPPPWAPNEMTLCTRVYGELRAAILSPVQPPTIPPYHPLHFEKFGYTPAFDVQVHCLVSRQWWSGLLRKMFSCLRKGPTPILVKTWGKIVQNVSCKPRSPLPDTTVKVGENITMKHHTTRIWCPYACMGTQRTSMFWTTR